ncbi:MAG: response regulator [Bacteroidetes bacterium]|nr:response regulator [Bacteroidota bacterium]
MEKVIKILLIEDNAGDVRLILEMLKEINIPLESLLVLSNLKEAFEIDVPGADISLVLLDLTLPDSDGVETVSEVRKKFPNSVIVILTGMSDEHIALSALREGAQDYLIKGESTSKELDKVIRFSTERQSIITRLNKSNAELIATKQELRELASHLQKIREEERTTISREIHDELGQLLTGLKMDVSWIRKKTDPQEEEIVNKFKDVNQMIDDTVKSVRKIAYELRPGILDDLGLNAALEWQSMEFQKRSGIRCSFYSEIDDAILNKEIVTNIFRIYQETLTNVIRHSEATKVTCGLFSDGNSYILNIHDNGKGFDQADVNTKHTLGLVGMRERSTMISGSLKIESIPMKGTTVVLKVPVVK